MSPLDPRKHHRRSIRLPGRDYRTPAAYFLTIFTHQREYLFEDQTWADIASTAWIAIPTHADRVILDEWELMPNHIHGVLILTNATEGGAPVEPFTWRWAAPLLSAEPRQFDNVVSGSLGSIVRAYKAAVTRRINERCGTLGVKRWQRGYYERIVRDDHELGRTRVYIQENPTRWAERSR